MKTLMMTLAAAAALTAGAAAAQPYGYARGYDRGYEGNRWMPIDQRQDMLERRIERGMETGQLTRGEAWRLRREFTRISNLEARYRSNGLSAWERADLDRRFDALSAQIRYERRDGDRYGDNRRYDRPRY